MLETEIQVSPAVTVIGVGNTILLDEGAGVHMCRHLERQWKCSPPVVFQYAETSGLGIADLMAGYDVAVILDTILAPDPPGTVKVIQRQELLKPTTFQGLAGHALGLKRGLEFARLTGELPGDVVLVAIVPKIIEYGEGLSTRLQEAMGKYEAAVRDTLKVFGIIFLSRTDGDEDGKQ